jgi:hypothetical protein
MTAEDGLKFLFCLFSWLTLPRNTSPFSVLHQYISLYLLCWSECVDLTRGNPVAGFGGKPTYHLQRVRDSHRIPKPTVFLIFLQWKQMKSSSLYKTTLFSLLICLFSFVVLRMEHSTGQVIYHWAHLLASTLWSLDCSRLTSSKFYSKSPSFRNSCQSFHIGFHF